MEPFGTRQQPTPEHTLSHRISNLSEVTDYETYEGYQANAPGDASRSHLRGRESLVSLQSAYDPAQPVSESPATFDPPSQPSSRTSSWSTPFSQYGREGSGYESVPVSTGPTPQRSRTFSRKPSLPRTHAPIVEEPEDYRESIDMATLSENVTLVKNAVPFASSGKGYAAVPDDEDADGPGMPFDVTGYMGPATSQDEAFNKRLQEQEANGKLTGGLGAGFGAGTTIKESDLLAASPIVERGGLGRAFTKRATFSRQPPMNRQGTVKALAQNEANKRGEIVEVIMEEPDTMAADVDLSLMVGPTPAGESYETLRRSTLPELRQKTVVVYPQPDWKPFSMRWPYLLLLIVMSAGLGVAQEALYQASTRQNLLEFHVPSDVPGIQYVAFKFGPTLVGVTFGVLWQITDFEVKRLEAFYQLSKEKGALADESINVDYITNFSFLRPLRALYCGHYAVAISSVASLLAVSLVPTMVTASIVLNPGRAERAANPMGLKYVTIQPVWSRCLSGVLALIAVLGGVLFWLLQSRRSGLLGDVKGIAGLASLAVVSHILMDFKGMDVATHQDIHQKLKDHRYVLRNSALARDDAIPVTTDEAGRYDKVNHLSTNPHPLMLRPWGGIPFIIGIVVFAGLIPTVLFTPANVITDRAAWVFTALAVCIKLAWGGLETSVRMLEPFYILSRRHAPPKTLTLDYTAMPFAWVAVQALLNRHVLVFLVGFGAVLAELLTVLVTSLATVEGRDFLSALGDDDSPGGGPGLPSDSDYDINAGEETELSFWITLGLVSFILLYLGAVATVTYARRRRPFLPRQPNTIASVLAFIHQSRMLYDFVGTSKLGSAEMVRALEGVGKTYGLGWFRGRDGHTHCGVDEEELMSNYKLGYDYSRSNMPWLDRPEVWL